MLFSAGLLSGNRHFSPKLLAAVGGALWLPLVAQQAGLDAPQPVAPFANGVFPVSSPGTPTGWEAVNAFPNLSFVDPLSMREVPGSDEFLLVGKDGQLWRFANDPAVTQAEVTRVLDWRAATETSGDQGFYSAVFHPRFGQAGEAGEHDVYVCYNHRPVVGANNNDQTYWRVSRFQWQPASGTLDPASEFVLINQYDPQSWHNGGAMFFGDDGFLYISCGDGGAGNDSLGNSQRTDLGFFGGVFRIDVDNDPSKSHPIRRQPGENPAWAKPSGAAWPASSSQGYGIPDDNPWQDPGGGLLEEFFAVGLRSPHTMHPDPVTGDIWIGDVGQGTREELTRIRSGSNGQWAFQEGLAGGPRAKPSTLIGVEEIPVHDYGRGTGSCIIGGMRYRGAKWDAELGGKVLFGDHARGRVWTLTPDSGGGAPVIEEILDGLDTGNKVGLGNFCTDSAGEVYLMNLAGTDQGGGTILRLETQGVADEPPQWLSGTGVFTDLATLETAPGVIPYDVASPLWSDAAAKRRWVILPNDGLHDSAAEQITFSEEGNWVFPPGTVFVKHFEVALSEADPSQVKRLETRFLVCTADGGKYGVTYRWNEEGTDAELLAGGLSEAYDVALAGGGVETRTWDYPSRADCLLCHNEAAGQALGFRTAPLNRDFLYESTGRTANQLRTFNSLGMFGTTLGPQQLADFIEARPLDDETAPLEHRVRSYLDSNCAHCHQPGAQFEGFDSRLGTPLNRQGLVDGLIQGFFDLGPDGRYVKAGDPSLSALHVRLGAVGDGDAMPPLAKNLVDTEAVAALGAWIDGLDPSEFEAGAAPEARFVRLTAFSEVNGEAWTSVGEFTVLDGNGAAIPVGDVALFDYDSEELGGEFAPAANALDGNPDTYWHTQWNGGSPVHPHHLTLDLGAVRELGGYVYVPRQGQANGRIADYEVHYSSDAANWTLMDAGTWPNSGAEQRFEELVGKRAARCQLAGPAGTVAGAFEVTVVFDMDVTGFDASDLQVSGGSVSSLRGSGYYYVATIAPSAATVEVAVSADAVDPAGLGSRPSETLSLAFVDTLPPVPVFTGVPSQVSGAFEIGLDFGEEVTGLDPADLVVGNGTLDAILPDGDGYRLAVTPLEVGTVKVEVLAGAVTDTAGNVMGAGTSINLLHVQQVLARDAGDHASIAGGMVIVPDASAPQGEYLWLPDGAYPGNWNPPVKPEHRAEYEFVVPQTGAYRLRGLHRSTDTSSDSFWVEFDGNQALGTVYLWDTQPVGSADYEWDYLNDRNGADPVSVQLAAGGHRVTVYGRDDGTRLGRLELESVRPLATLSGPVGPVAGPFAATLAFSESVTGVEVADFSISGGEVTGVSGSGSLYTVEVAPTASSVSLTLPQNVVSDGEGEGNHASNPLTLGVLTRYQQWALAYGVDGSPATQLADEDGDGIVKLLEFAFGLDPSQPDLHADEVGPVPPSGLPVAVVLEEGGGYRLALRYLRRKQVPGLSYEPQFGSSPGLLSPVAGTPVVEDVDAEWERVTVPDTETSETAPTRFGRVGVSLENP